VSHSILRTNNDEKFIMFDNSCAYTRLSKTTTTTSTPFDQGEFSVRKTKIGLNRLQSPLISPTLACIFSLQYFIKVIISCQAAFSTLQAATRHRI